MKIILLSGGSGKRLWPLSNEARSKQFLKLLTSPTGEAESMVQRIVRQIDEAGLNASVTIATSESQKDSITNQLGKSVEVVTEPERRDTFPAIALATSYLQKELKCDRDETVVVMPVDPYTEIRYFEVISKMAQAVEDGAAELVLMGIEPDHASTKFGYVVPNNSEEKKEIYSVSHFTEKPNEERANELIAQNAFWNGGVFAFKLGYLTDIVEKYITADTFQEIRSRYGEFPKISFDYEVAEKATSVAVVPFKGEWKDLGTWNSLVEKMSSNVVGKALIGECAEGSYVVNELDIPVVCLGTKDIIVAASPDGIMVSEKEASVQLKSYADKFNARPMYEERRWGSYKVMGYNVFEDGYKVLTKQLCIKAGAHISYQYHNKREEVWTFVDGEGELILDDVKRKVSRGDVIRIMPGQKHSVMAITPLHVIEVQAGTDLVEEDIIRLPYQW